MIVISRASFLRMAGPVMMVLLLPMVYQRQTASKEQQPSPPAPPHRYSLTFPDQFSVCATTPAQIRWKNSLVRNLHHQGNVHVFMLTDLALFDRGVERKGLVYQNIGNRDQFMVTPEQDRAVVIDRRQSLVGTMGCAGVSIHPHPRGQMIVCLEPSPCGGIIGVDLFYCHKWDVEPPVFTDNKVSWTWEPPGPGKAQDRIQTIHVFVALCDNEHQGIVPVPEELGKGDDPAHNLYWGARYGVKTFLSKSPDWTLVKTEENPCADVLQRIILKHKKARAYLVADAYRGDQIRKTILDFLDAASGNNPATLDLEKESVGLHGGADLVAYVGHNGRMDFNIDVPTPQKEAKPRDAVVLACKSKPYFLPHLSQLRSKPVLLTTGFMAPEAYTLEAAVGGWLAGESAETVKERAALAYDKHQKCGLQAARRLFYSE